MGIVFDFLFIINEYFVFVPFVEQFYVRFLCIVYGTPTRNVCQLEHIQCLFFCSTTGTQITALTCRQAVVFIQTLFVPVVRPLISAATSGLDGCVWAEIK